MTVSIVELARVEAVTGLPFTKSREEFVATMRAKGAFTCAICQTEILGPPPTHGLGKVCDSCIPEARARLRERLPMAEALKGTGCPPRFRTTFRSEEVGENGVWPQDQRPGWEMDLREWQGQPLGVTLAGPNGGGKSSLAAFLMYRCHQARHFNGFWTRPAALIREDREMRLGEPRPLLHRAETADVLVLDELGLGHCRDDDLELIVDLVDLRWSRHRPTIFTTHRPLGSRGGEGSIEAMSRGLYDRLRDGLMVHLNCKSKRGQR